MMKHTPGPWRLEIDDDDYCIMSGNNHLIAIIEGMVGEYDKDEHDARLIAAAPSLLEALRKIVGLRPLSIDKVALLVTGSEIQKVANAAIAQAEAQD